MEILNFEEPSDKNGNEFRLATVKEVKEIIAEVQMKKVLETIK